MSFNEFEIKVRKAFGNLVPNGARHVWMDPNRCDGMRYCAALSNGMFVTGNRISKQLVVYKDRFDKTPTIIPV